LISRAATVDLADTSSGGEAATWVLVLRAKARVVPNESATEAVAFDATGIARRLFDLPPGEGNGDPVIL
jgi:hypothetical protein